jgi:putative NADH-flavin reductase
MQTILGANGIIGEELARELRKNYTDKVQLVGRNPQKVHPYDLLFKADLLDQESVIKSLNNTEIALDSRTSVRF